MRSRIFVSRLCSLVYIAHICLALLLLSKRTFAQCIVYKVKIKWIRLNSFRFVELFLCTVLLSVASKDSDNENDEENTRTRHILFSCLQFGFYLRTYLRKFGFNSNTLSNYFYYMYN